MKSAGEEHSCRAIEMGWLVLNGTETLNTHGAIQAAKRGQTGSHGRYCCKGRREGAASVMEVSIHVCGRVQVSLQVWAWTHVSQRWIIVLQQM